jgi:hypothetical protein
VREHNDVLDRNSSVWLLAMMNIHRRKAYSITLQCLWSGRPGLYVGKCFEESKRRPLYFVRATSNL